MPTPINNQNNTPGYEAVNDFLDTAARKEKADNTAVSRRVPHERQKSPWLKSKADRRARSAAEYITSPQNRRQLSAIDAFNRIDEMSDEEFNRAKESGELTPQEIRAAGEYFLDNWIGDVWREGDHDDEPDPTYDEFYADPSKYGHTKDSFGQHLERYRVNNQ